MAPFTLQSVTLRFSVILADSQKVRITIAIPAR